MNKVFSKFFLLFFLVLSIVVNASSVDIYFGPQGGFCESNNTRVLEFSDGLQKPATLANAFLHRLERLEDGSMVKIAMYSMNDYCTLDAMIEAALSRNIRFKLLLCGASSWTVRHRERIANKVREAREKAWEQDIEFEFQLAIVTADAMRRNGRHTTLDCGKLIWGTMHEKFGIFYAPDNPIPHSAFNGSANISYNSDEIYAENRVFFDNQPAVARLLQEQFARLWNEYSTSVVGPWTPERFLPASHVPGYTDIIFNAEPVNELAMTRIDSELLSMIGRVEENGSLDLAMFSLTRLELVDQILRVAARRPDAKFRILLDHSQLDDSNPDAMRQGPTLERRAREKGLDNIQVRYRFRVNAYSFNQRENKPDLLSFLSLFWHHKTLTVNDNEMALGSYNWSFSAEFLNFENMMFFNALYKDHQDVIDRFKSEFDVMWNSRMPATTRKKPERGKPQTVTLEEGQRLHNILLKTLSKPANYKVLQTMDREAFKTFEQIKELTGFNARKVNRALHTLKNRGFVVKWNNNGVKGYSQAD